MVNNHRSFEVMDGWMDDDDQSSISALLFFFTNIDVHFFFYWLIFFNQIYYCFSFANCVPVWILLAFSFKSYDDDDDDDKNKVPTIRVNSRIVYRDHVVPPQPSTQPKPPRAPYLILLPTNRRTFFNNPFNNPTYCM